MNRRIAVQLAASAVFLRNVHSNPAEKKGFRVAEGDDRLGEHIRLGGSPLDSKLAARDSADALAIFEHTTPGQGGAPLHIHLNQDEWWYVVKGEFQFQIGDERFRAKAGDTVWAPRQVAHGFAQVSSEQGKYIIVFSPAGEMEAFFREVSKFQRMPNEYEWRRLFGAHGMRYIAPFQA